MIGTTEEGIVDGTFKILTDYILENNLQQVKIVVSQDIKFSSNRFDGDIKNFALQNTKYPIKIQMDMDEIFVLSQKPKWIGLFDLLLESECQALFIPSVDLYGSKETIRKNHNLGQKWRIHKEGLKRGVWKGAELENGLFSTSKSDSSELLDKDSNLVSTLQIVNDYCLQPKNAHNLLIYTLHLGYLNLSYRQKINENWWKDKWYDRMLKNENVETNIKNLETEETINHNLPLV